jgi:hypothetical protein
MDTSTMHVSSPTGPAITILQASVKNLNPT